MVGIIDPLRAEAKGAVETALGAGIDVRMITGDHAVTAQAIGETARASGRARSAGPSCRRCRTRSSIRRLPELHVFGRVTPQDKLRLARLMQEQGLIVAMTGDAVNDAAALKQADIGVAMGSGSEVTKQAGRMILTDDNFGTLVHAVEIGRRVYEKVVSYVRYQMTQLLSLVLLFLAATAFDINDGVALTPADGAVPALLRRPPPASWSSPSTRARRTSCTGRRATRSCRSPTAPPITLWVVYAATLFVAALIPLVAGPDDPSTDVPTASLTMTFVVMGLGTVFNALTNRRDPASGLAPPLLKALGDLALPDRDDRRSRRSCRASRRACSPPRSPAPSGWPASGSPRSCRW